jgi:hypothetical protein
MPGADHGFRGHLHVCYHFIDGCIVRLPTVIDTSGETVKTDESGASLGRGSDLLYPKR